jgi:hypothetical protein
MIRCPECGERLPGDPDRYGARCPDCREPLYDEPPPRRRRIDAQCPVHPENVALGTCARCGNYLCVVCRTRWRQRWLCAACVDLSLERREVVPAQASAHLRQAILALALGGGCWALILLCILFAVASQNIGAVVLAGFVMLASPLPSAIGLGQGIAAIRARGDHMILATLGLILCGLNVGVFIGLMTFGMALQM